MIRDITNDVMEDRIKSIFLSNVSHELRTPLTSIKGYADLMLMGASGEMSAQQVHFMRIIRENTQRLNNLVNDLLEISHIDAEQLTLSCAPLNLSELAEEILASTHRRSIDQNKPMQLSLQAPENLPHVWGDHERVRQVLMSLVSNSFAYTPANGSVTLRLCDDTTHVQVDVIDSGIGIALDAHEQVFDRFYRGDHPLVQETAGSGLGLAISRALVELHGGEMWFESQGIPGEGCVFSFTLPKIAKVER